jgi:shikimate kinase
MPTARPPGQHIVLLGTMGSGKTTVGRRLASMLGWPFWDNDDRLFQQDARTAAELAHIEGADELHRREAEVLLEGLDQPGPAVVAAAAATVLDPRVRERLHATTWVVWLRAEPHELEARLADPGARPSLGSTPAQVAVELQRARTDLYRAVANQTLDTTSRDPADLATAILSEISRRRATRVSEPPRS